MGTLKVRNCTIWNVHYWRKTEDSNAVVKPGEEGTYDYGATFTLGVKRVDVSPEGKDYRQAVDKNGIYYIVWDSKKNELKILSEEEGSNYPVSNDNKYLTNWFKKYSNWMSNLDGKLTLDKFSIPGTHDTGTKNVFHGTFRTQNFDVATQLKDGIRFLDIRLDQNGLIDDTLLIRHWCEDCDLTFDEVLDSCKSFLNQNSRETIIMLVNACGCLPFDLEGRFKKYLDSDKYKSLFYIGGEIPNLDTVRGKIVLLRRFPIESSQTMGIDLSLEDAWGKNETFTLTTPKGNKFQIEDNYSEHDTNKKVNYVEANLNNAISNPSDGIMYVTFSSISAKATHTPYKYAWGGSGIDPAMNPTLRSYLMNKTGNHRFGTIMMDFYNNEGSDNEIVALIVQSNDGLKK